MRSRDLNDKFNFNRKSATSFSESRHTYGPSTDTPSHEPFSYHDLCRIKVIDWPCMHPIVQLGNIHSLDLADLLLSGRCLNCQRSRCSIKAVRTFQQKLRGDEVVSGAMGFALPTPRYSLLPLASISRDSRCHAHRFALRRKMTQMYQ